MSDRSAYLPRIVSILLPSAIYIVYWRLQNDWCKTGLECGSTYKPIEPTFTPNAHLIDKEVNSVLGRTPQIAYHMLNRSIVAQCRMDYSTVDVRVERARDIAASDNAHYILNQRLLNVRFGDRNSPT